MYTLFIPTTRLSMIGRALDTDPTSLKHMVINVKGSAFLFSLCWRRSNKRKKTGEGGGEGGPLTTYSRKWSTYTLNHIHLEL